MSEPPVSRTADDLRVVEPSVELDHQRETVEVLSDPEAKRDLADTEVAVRGIEDIRALVAERINREPQ